jgi:hypothetical protein
MMKPSMIFWAVVQGNSRCRVRGDTYEAALMRAKQFGFAKPDSVIRETDQVGDMSTEMLVDRSLGKEAVYGKGITKRVVGEKK